MNNLQKSTTPGFSIDQSTGAVINTNVDELQRVRMERNQVKVIAAIERDVSMIKRELDICKTLISDVIKKLA